MAKRTSIYLEKKAEALIEALSFFSREQGKSSLNERLLIFLAQIRFWDWELESLLYSIRSFDERQRAWASTDNIEEHLRKEGFLFRHGVIKKVEDNRREDRWFAKIFGDEKDKVVPPSKNLESLVKQWNELLRKCEERILDPNAEAKAKDFGILDVKVDLSEFRKTLNG